jgi:hypothetical protein
MDSPLSADEALLSQDPLDVVEHVLEAENLQFDRTERGALASALFGGGATSASASPGGRILRLPPGRSPWSMRAPQALRGQVFELLAGVNARASLGLFETRDDGEILFRFGTPLLPGRVSRPRADRRDDRASPWRPPSASSRPSTFASAAGAAGPRRKRSAACMFETVGVA